MTSPREPSSGRGARFAIAFAIASVATFLCYFYMAMAHLPRSYEPYGGFVFWVVLPLAWFFLPKRKRTDPVKEARELDKWSDADREQFKKMRDKWKA
jgi:hypothetical protein